MLLGSIFVLSVMNELVSSASVPITRCTTINAAGVSIASSTARICKDNATGCDILFPVDANHNDLTHVSANCYPVSTLSLSCANRCALCCEDPKHACNDKKNCTAFAAAGLCTNPASDVIAKVDCAGTCGYCNQPGTGGAACPDTIPNCQELLDTGFSCDEEFMLDVCGRLCRSLNCLRSNITTTTLAACKDLRNNCHLSVSLCSRTETSKYMAIYCRKSCDLCK